MALTIDYDTETKIWKSCNKPQFEYVNATIGELFLKNTKIVEPTKVLESHYDTGVDRTMTEIHRDSVTIAINMRDLGLKQGDIVVFYSNNNSKITPLTMGCYLMGLPANFFETKFNSAYQKYTLELLSPTVILFEEEFRTNLENTVNNSTLPNLKHLISIDGTSDGTTVESLLLKSITAAQLEHFEAPALGDPQQVVATYILTSGSTGLPKAVALSHASMLSGILNVWNEPSHSFDITKDYIISSYSPLRWISQLILGVQSLILGVRRICVFKDPIGEIGREIIRSKRITHLISTPFLLQNIVQATDHKDLDALDSLHSLLIGGDTVAQNIIELTKKLAPKAVIMCGYGMSELSGPMCINGYIAHGWELKILNDHGQTVGPNTNGQVVLRSPVPILGYLNISREKDFYKDGFFNTGDYGYIDDNKALHVIARYKNLVRCKDVILIPKHVEDMINTIPEISSSVLVGYRKSASATADTATIFIKLAPEVKTSPGVLFSKIRELLKSQLKLQQDDIFEDIQIIDKFPLSSCGKVERVELAQLAAKNK